MGGDRASGGRSSRPGAAPAATSAARSSSSATRSSRSTRSRAPTPRRSTGCTPISATGCRAARACNAHGARVFLPLVAGDPDGGRRHLRGHGGRGPGAGQPPRRSTPSVPGRVDLWPVVPDPEKEDEGAWYDPVDQPAPNAAHVVLAKAIAGEIAAADRGGRDDPRPRDGRRADDRGRRADPRAAAQPALSRDHPRLQGRGARRRGRRPAAPDGRAGGARPRRRCCRFLALPEDDLSLAAALRSPLFGWTEGQLYDLAAGRDGFLWEALRAAAASPETVSGAATTCAAQADFLRPYDLIERILIRHGGRERLVARLGAEAEDGDRRAAATRRWPTSGCRCRA